MKKTISLKSYLIFLSMIFITIQIVLLVIALLSSNMLLDNNLKALYSFNNTIGMKTEDINIFFDTTYYKINHLFIYSTIASIFFAIIITAFICHIFAKNTATLSSYVRNLNLSETAVDFEKTRFTELNDLSKDIEALAKTISHSSKNISKIMSLTGIPMGIFDLSYDSEYVFVTDYILELINKPPNSLINKIEWIDVYSEIISEPVENYEDVYAFADKKTFRLLYLRIVEITTDSNKMGIITNVTEDVEKTRTLKIKLDFDPLTNLYSRQAFKEKTEALINDEPAKKGALIFADLDSLKYINDTFGHDMGDKYIVVASELFSDFSEYGGIVSRISGDEFAIYIHGYDDYECIRDIVIHEVNKNNKFKMLTPDGNTHIVRSSTGLAWYPKDADNVTDLLKLADYAMYEAKHNRKGTLYEFNMDSYNQNSYILDKRESLNRLIDGALVNFHFQPIVDLKTGEVFAYEALMRSMVEDFKTPAEIISVAASQSKLYQIERLTMFKAFEYLKTNINLFNGYKIFINSLPSEKLSNEDFFMFSSTYKDIFKYIVFEITEIENNDINLIDKKISRLRKLGTLIAVDDFGSGYSNELRILSVNPDVLKIDMDIIRDIDDDVDKKALVSNIVSYCKPKGIKIIAEGVETISELSTVIGLEIDYVQGFLTGKPSPKPKTITLDIVETIKELNKKY